jgi:hypothetical protein
MIYDLTLRFEWLDKMIFYGRRAALVLCVFFLIVFSLSTVFALVYGDHEHDHDGEEGCCSVCAQITAFHNLWKRLGVAPPGEGAAREGGDVLFVSALFRSWIYFPTLTALKMRMNS